jgi:hypothetical protein
MEGFMVKLVRALPALTVVTLASCREAPTAEPMSKAPASVTLEQTPAVQVFRVKFDELNASGVKAEATLQVRGGDLTVTLDAVGRVPQQIHPQHIHGFAAQTSTCPTAANDTDGDGVISFAEGSPAFGPVQVDLLPYPTPANAAGATHYRVTFVASDVPFTASELTQKTMVLHGDFVGGSYVAALPVACGRVEAVN